MYMCRKFGLSPSISLITTLQPLTVRHWRMMIGDSDTILVQEYDKLGYRGVLDLHGDYSGTFPFAHLRATDKICRNILD